MLHRQVNDGLLGDQLLAIACDPTLRQSVYLRLGEYCHQCRNRLNSMKLSLYLAQRASSESHGGRWEAIEGHYRELEARIERIQTICRPMVLSPVTVGLDLLVEDRRGDWAALLADRGGELDCVAPSERAVASLDVDRFGSALDALAAWRAGAISPGTTTRLRWRVEAGRAHLTWEEDRPRMKFSLPPDHGPDRTWTLPFLARVISAHEGDLLLRDGDGWRIDLSWPAASR